MKTEPRMPLREDLPSEFSRRVRLSELEGRGLTCEIEANPEERAALAARFDLQSLDRLVATVQVHPEDALGRIRAEGRFAADVVQTCVVTLDPVPAHVEDSFTARFAKEAAVSADTEVIIDAEDPPEPIEGDTIDIGETVAQHFAMALDPYPRAADASIDALEADLAAHEDVRRSPFDVLARLKRQGE